MKPTSESTALEGSEGFVEYVGAGKLKHKKAFITGGEYAFPIMQRTSTILITSHYQLRHWPRGGYSVCT